MKFMNLFIFNSKKELTSNKQKQKQSRFVYNQDNQEDTTNIKEKILYKKTQYIRYKK